MVSFVWSSKYPFLSGTGGSENYTAGQIRELRKRGIEARIITVGLGLKDGRADFPDIEFYSIKSKAELSELDDILVFVTYPLAVATKHPSYVILHCPTPEFMQDDDQFDPAGMKGKRVITNSRFSLRHWSGYYAKTITKTAVVYPFADEAFSEVPRASKPHDKVKILFAGRLKSEKGIFTLLEALHMAPLQQLDFSLTVTTAGTHTQEGRVIAKMLRAHPWVKVVSRRKTPAQVARLLADHDILAMPSTNIYWKEAFGMLSIEGQHAGCRVVASKAGGLPETDCGGLVTIKPDNPLALAQGIAKAAQLGPLTEAERARASQFFTVEQSVDSLLKIMKLDGQLPHITRLHEPLIRISQLSEQWALLGRHLKR